jgi:mRNA-degrading endonuclease toxin of MazEF toxin-antitoxin module
MTGMPLPRIQRGELWIVDLGYLGKVRPVVVASVPFLEKERTLCIIVPHTTSVIGTRFEVTIKHPALDAAETLGASIRSNGWGVTNSKTGA